MNKLAKAGAILVIIASAFMIIAGLYILLAGQLFFAMLEPYTAGVTWMFTVIGIVILVFAGINLVLAILILSGKQNVRIATGVIAIISIIVGWSSYIFPAILLLIGGILILCGKSVKTEQTIQVSEAVNVNQQSNN